MLECWHSRLSFKSTLSAFLSSPSPSWGTWGRQAFGQHHTVVSEFSANYIWPNSFFRSSLLFILPVMVLGSSETNSTWLRIKQTHTKSPRYFLSTLSSPPLPSHSPPERLAPCGGLNGVHHLCQILLWPPEVGCSPSMYFDQWNMRRSEVCYI